MYYYVVCSLRAGAPAVKLFRQLFISPLALDVAHGDIGAVAQQHIDPDALPVAEPVAGTLHLDQARTRWRGVLRYGRGGRGRGTGGWVGMREGLQGRGVWA